MGEEGGNGRSIPVNTQKSAKEDININTYIPLGGGFLRAGVAGGGGVCLVTTCGIYRSLPSSAVPPTSPITISFPSRTSPRSVEYTLQATHPSTHPLPR